MMEGCRESRLLASASDIVLIAMTYGRFQTRLLLHAFIAYARNAGINFFQPVPYADTTRQALGTTPSLTVHSGTD
jgi:hypothetical protein